MAPGGGEAAVPADEYLPRGGTGIAAAGLARSKAGTRPAAGVLADRLAAALVHHEPGWRLPRHTALARRYNVSPAEIESAVGELVSRHLIRRLADGQLYRASPAEYLIALEGVSGLASSLDPMGGEVACRSRQVSWRRVPEDICWALGLAASATACVVRFLWTVGGEPAAYTTTYLPAEVAAPAGADVATLPESLCLLPQPNAAQSNAALSNAALSNSAQSNSAQPDTPQTGSQAGEGLPLDARPQALQIEIQPPPPAVARSLRLPAGQPATIVTIRFDNPERSRPVALTIAVLRSDMFRVVLQSPQVPLADGGGGSFAGVWTHLGEDWEP